MVPDAGWLEHLPQGTAFLAAAGVTAAGCAALRVALARTGAGRAFIRGLHILEGTAVALLLAAMLVLSFGQILLRNMAHTGLLWVDPLLRHLLLWVGFLGATLATRLDRHINVDAFTRVLGGPALRIARCLSSLGAAAICLVLTGACVTALREEAGAGTVGFLDIPVWCLQVVMPVALFVMSSRFFRHAAESLTGKPHVPPPLGVPLGTGDGGMILLVVLVFGLALLGMPLFTVLGVFGLLGFHATQVASTAVAVEMYRLADAPLLIAIPMFTFAGYLLAESRAPERLVAVSRAVLGWLPGGLALVALVACALFTAFTGASGVTIIAVGGLLMPALLADGYNRRFVDGLLTTSGSLGLLFPPSLPIILYGYVASTSIDKLFAAGFLPGVLLLVVLGAYAARVSRRTGAGHQAFSWAELRRSVRGAAWELPLPIVVIGGIYSGKVTLTEAASLTAMYALVVEVLVYRDIKPRDLSRILTESMVLVGGILVILATALALTNYFITAEVPTRLFDWIQQYVHSKAVFLILLNVFLLIVGCLMDVFSAILVVVPLIAPVAAGYAVDPVHLGIIFLLNLEIGYSTPPVGLNLFIASLRFGRPVVELYRAAVPFLLLYLLVLAVTTYLPVLSLGLVRLLGVR